MKPRFQHTLAWWKPGFIPFRRDQPELRLGRGLAVRTASSGAVAMIRPPLEQIAADRVARTLSAWSVSSSVTIAALTALWGLLANATSPRTAIAVAGVLILATPLLLPRCARTLGEQERELVASF